MESTGDGGGGGGGGQVGDSCYFECGRRTVDRTSSPASSASRERAERIRYVLSMAEGGSARGLDETTGPLRNYLSSKAAAAAEVLTGSLTQRPGCLRSFCTTPAAGR